MRGNIKEARPLIEALSRMAVLFGGRSHIRAFDGIGY
jgi:hypothetical protein